MNPVGADLLIYYLLGARDVRKPLVSVWLHPPSSNWLIWLSVRHQGRREGTWYVPGFVGKRQVSQLTCIRMELRIILVTLTGYTASSLYSGDKTDPSSPHIENTT